MTNLMYILNEPVNFLLLFMKTFQNVYDGPHEIPVTFSC